MIATSPTRLFLLALGLGACSAVGSDPQAEADLDARADTAQLQQPIVGGETDREHTAVLAIATITPEFEALCTGSLIAPNLVLTARHCVVPVEEDTVDCELSTFPAPYAASAVWVSPSTSVRGASLYPVREILVPRDDGALCGADVALLILDGQFSSSISPIVPRLDDPAERGEAFTAVGFGSALADGSPGTRRELGGVEVLCGPDDCRAPDVLTTTEFLGEQAVCDGDSGGPALDSEGRLVGVASRASGECEWAVYSAVSPWRDWIVDVATRAGKLGNYTAPQWLTSAVQAGPRGNEAAAADEAAIDEAAIDAVATLEPNGPGEVEGDVALDAPTLGGSAPSASRGSSGCSLGGAQAPPASTSPLWLGACAVALVGWRRRGRSVRA